MSIRTRNLFRFFVFIIIALNVVAFFHAYKFTHFSTEKKVRSDPKEFNLLRKLQTFAFGIDNPRPFNTDKPSGRFETLVIPHGKDTLACWHVPVDDSKGTVLIFHGYAGNKSQMVKESDQFNDLGYTTIVVDFLGSGGSTGNRTTIGYYEADQVKAVFDFAKRNDHERIIMFGTSMGAVAIMKSIHDHNLEPESIILECPFGDMLETVQARFRIMKAPVFPMSYLLTFWGGAQNGFDAFSHDPIDYAEEISVKTLLLYGMKDDRVSLKETELIFKNLTGPKELKLYPDAGHESILLKYPGEWISVVGGFIDDGSARRSFSRSPR